MGARGDVKMVERDVSGGKRDIMLMPPWSGGGALSPDGEVFSLDAWVSTAW